MLLGDGSPTRHLRLLTGSPVAVDLIAMEADQTDHPGAPEEVNELMVPLLRRQVWLTCGGKSLLLDECARTSVDPEQRKALCNGAAGYQHDMAPGLRKGRHLDREALEC